MARAKVNLESKKVEEKEEGLKRSLTQIMEQEDIEEKERHYISMLLEQGQDLRESILSAEKRLDEIKDELSAIMLVNDLKGIRHNNLVFTSRYQEGRKTFSQKDCRTGLAMEGVDLSVINKCFDEATKQGEGYYVRQLERLDD